MDVTERLISLAMIESTSDGSSEVCPSTPSQFDVANEVVRQMKEIGIEDAFVDENCYVYGTIPANCDDYIPVYGLIAHMDTSPDACGKNVKPRITDIYDGGDIILNREKGIIMSPSEFPSLKRHIGKHLIVTDGTTLLGSDDKTGIAEILSAAEIIINSPKKHGKIRLGFTPDEEIGRGTDLFDIDSFGADYAYTVDGGPIGEIEYENFNAASAIITINGKSVHPGSAKNIMVNASLVAIELNSYLPEKETPYYTEGYEGFFHLLYMESKCEQGTLVYLLRDHDLGRLNQRKAVMEDAVSKINEKYGEGTAVLVIEDSYYNMKEKIAPHMFLIDNALRAFSDKGIEAKCVPIRGGTDGARLSYKGLPCPNLPTGGDNFHGRFEYAVKEDMETISEVIADLMWMVAGN